MGGDGDETGSQFDEREVEMRGTKKSQKTLILLVLVAVVGVLVGCQQTTIDATHHTAEVVDPQAATSPVEVVEVVAPVATPARRYRPAPCR